MDAPERQGASLEPSHPGSIHEASPEGAATYLDPRQAEGTQGGDEVDVRKVSKELRTPSRSRVEPPHATAEAEAEPPVQGIAEGEAEETWQGHVLVKTQEQPQEEPASAEVEQDTNPEREKRKRSLAGKAKSSAGMAKRYAGPYAARLRSFGKELEWKKLPGHAADGVRFTGRWLQVNAKQLREGGLPQLSTWENLVALPWLYCEKMGRVPYVFVMVYFVLLSIIIGMPWRTAHVNTNLDLYRSVDAPAARAHHTYLDVLDHQFGNYNSSSLEGRPAYQVNLFYEAKIDHVFSEASLLYIRSLEQELRNLPGWQRLCNESGQEASFRCEPGESLINFAWPMRTDLEERNYDYFHLSFDGRSDERLPVTATLAYLQETDAQSLSLYLPEQLSDSEKQTSTWLRSVASFTAPVGDDGSYKERFDEFLATELFPKLRDMVDKTAEEQADLSLYENPIPIRLYFRGKELSDYEMKWTLAEDCKLAIGVLILVWLLMAFLARSAFLGLAMFFTLLLAVAVAYAAVVVDEVSMVSFLGIFLVMVLGTDSLLLAVKMWHRAGEYFRGDGRIAERIAVLIVSMAINIAPELLTACAFAVLLASSFLPFREFGFHMVAGIATCSLLAVTFFVPVIVANETIVTPFLQQRAPKVTKWLLEPDWCQWPTKTISKLVLGIIQRGRRPGCVVVSATAFITVIFLVSTVLVTTISTDVRRLPEILDASHQREVGRVAVEAFPSAQPSVVPAPSETVVCGLDQAATGEVSNCGLHWCEAPLATEFEVSNDCTCFTKFATTSAELSRSRSCQRVNTTLLLSGVLREDFTEAEWRTMHADYISRAYSRGVAEWYGSARQVSPLVLEHWESGRTDLDRLVVTAQGLIEHDAELDLFVDDDCHHQGICHCGHRSCGTHPGFVGSDEDWLLPRRLGSPETKIPGDGLWRRLTNDSADIVEDEETANSADEVGWDAEIAVVIGVTQAPRPSEYFAWTNYLSRTLKRDYEWNFDEYFDAALPAAQRDLLRLCTDFPAWLQVHSARCWIVAFKAWLDSRGEVFPLERFADFSDAMQDFLLEFPDWNDDLWIGEDGAVQATRFYIRVTRARGASTKDILAERDAWTGYVFDKNLEATTLANKAWPTAKDWVIAEAEDAALTSAWVVASLALLATFLSGVLLLRDISFTLTVIVVNLVGVCGLAFCFFCIFAWRVGPWEVLLLTLLFCSTCRPAFRMGREYFAARREARVGEEAQPLAALYDSEDAPEEPSSDAGMLQVPKISSVVAHTGSAPPVAARFPSPVAALPRDIALRLDLEKGADGCESSFLYLSEEELLEVAKALDVQDFSDESLDPYSPEARILRALGVGVDAVLTLAVKLLICGIMLLPCRLALFSRLGCVAVILPFFLVPCNLIVLPAALLFIGPRHWRPDVDNLVLYTKDAYERWFLDPA